MFVMLTHTRHSVGGTLILDYVEALKEDDRGYEDFYILFVVRIVGGTSYYVEGDIIIALVTIVMLDVAFNVGGQVLNERRNNNTTCTLEFSSPRRMSYM